MSPSLGQRVQAGERVAVARAIRLLDDAPERAAELLRELYPALQGARIVGVTGAPGAGKSTLVDRLIEAFRARGDRVGVAAVDPSSPFTGGALLGDRVRMQRHAADDGVFIRSLATRGHLGGLSASTLDALAVLAAGGFRTLLVETVGVGQDEVEVNRVADTVVLVLTPGAGDAIQTLKAGILEIASVFVVNKADLPGADRAVHDLQQMLAQSEAGLAPPAWTPPVIAVCANDGRGLPELFEALERHAAHLDSSGEGGTRRLDRARTALHEVLGLRLEAELDRRHPGRRAAAARRVADGLSDPHGEAEALLRLFAEP